jgi:hypothetical protein
MGAVEWLIEPLAWEGDFVGGVKVTGAYRD